MTAGVCPCARPPEQRHYVTPVRRAGRVVCTSLLLWWLESAQRRRGFLQPHTHTHTLTHLPPNPGSQFTPTTICSTMLRRTAILTVVSARGRKGRGEERSFCSRLRGWQWSSHPFLLKKRAAWDLPHGHMVLEPQEKLSSFTNVEQRCWRTARYPRARCPASANTTELRKNTVLMGLY